MSSPPADKPIHLLEVGLIWPPETFLCWKLERLARRGFRVTVATVASRRATRQRLTGVRVRHYPHWEEPPARVVVGLLGDLAGFALTRPHRLRALLGAVRNPLLEASHRPRWETVCRLRWYLPLARLRPDVVHFEWNTSAIAFLPLARVWRCPVVISCHGSDVNIRPHTADAERVRAGLQRSLAEADAVHFVSAALIEEADRLGITPAQPWLIRPAVDADEFPPPEPFAAGRPETFKVVSVGHLRWLKGHEYAIQAIRHLRDSGVPAQLDIVGGDPVGSRVGDRDRERIVRTVEDLGLQEHVRLRGQISSATVHETLAGADVLLHASLSEGIPTAVLEAMSCELPVVVTDCGGLREAVTDGVEGFVVPVRDSRAAADALAALWRDPRRGHAMGRAGRRRVISDFSLDQQTEHFVELYRHVLNGGGRDTAPVSRGHLEPSRPREHMRAPDLRVLSVGELSWTRGYEHALHAIRLTIDDGVDCEYRIVGDGAHRDALGFACHQLGLATRVTFLPGGEPLGPHVEWADVVLDASVVDQPSSGALEATTQDLPVVSTTSLPRRDPRALAAQLVEVHAASERALQ